MRGGGNKRGEWGRNWSFIFSRKLVFFSPIQGYGWKRFNFCFIVFFFSSTLFALQASKLEGRRFCQRQRRLSAKANGWFGGHFTVSFCWKDFPLSRRWQKKKESTLFFPYHFFPQAQPMSFTVRAIASNFDSAGNQANSCCRMPDPFDTTFDRPLHD